MTDGAELTDRLAAALPDPLAEAVLAGTATVSGYSVPGLPDGTVWRVTLEGLDHPVQTYVGVAPDGPARILPDAVSAFDALVADCGGGRIQDGQTALGYVLAFLELTRGPQVIVHPLTSPDEIRWRPGTPEEEARRVAFLAETDVQPPTVESDGDRHWVSIWLVVDQRIQVNTFAVSAGGAIESSYRVVAQDLPLPIAR